MTRWFMQAGVINEGDDNPDLFPSPTPNFSLYKAYLGFFGKSTDLEGMS